MAPKPTQFGSTEKNMKLQEKKEEPLCIHSVSVISKNYSFKLTKELFSNPHLMENTLEFGSWGINLGLARAL